MAVCPMHVVNTCRASVTGGERDMPKSIFVELILAAGLERKTAVFNTLVDRQTARESIRRSYHRDR